MLSFDYWDLSKVLYSHRANGFTFDLLGLIFRWSNLGFETYVLSSYRSLEGGYTNKYCLL